MRKVVQSAIVNISIAKREAKVPGCLIWLEGYEGFWEKEKEQTKPLLRIGIAISQELVMLDFTPNDEFIFELNEEKLQVEYQQDLYFVAHPERRRGRKWCSVEKLAWYEEFVNRWREKIKELGNGN